MHDRQLTVIVIIICLCAGVMFFALSKAVGQQNAYDEACRKIGGTPAHAESFRGCFAPGTLLTVPEKDYK